MKKNKQLKQIPDFKSEDDEREFWAKNDSTDFIDWDDAQEVKFPNLKFSNERISLRLPLWLLEDIKIAANKRDVPYQSFIKMILAREIEKENKRTSL